MILIANADDIPLADESVQCVVTSPPYWNLRDYGIKGQLGLEKTPYEYVERVVSIFREVRRVLKPDGVVWLNMGDSYSHGGCGARDPERWPKQSRNDNQGTHNKKDSGFKPKDLIPTSWMSVIALQQDGWWFRQAIIWNKKTPMPESAKDRPTTSHEYIFLLSKSQHYFYDHEAIKEPGSPDTHARYARGRGDNTKYTTGDNSIKGCSPGIGAGVNPKAMSVPAGWDTSTGAGHKKKTGRYKVKQNESFAAAVKDVVATRNKRSVWVIGAQAYPEAHYATFPEEIPRICILAGSRPGDVILDPFGGSGTTGKVAIELGRKTVCMDLSKTYVRDHMVKRMRTTMGLPL